MDSDYDDYDDDLYDETDSGNESPEEEESDGDDLGMDPGFEDDQPGSSNQKIEDEYYFEAILKHSQLKT